MRTTPVPLIGGFYSDEDKPWSVQDVCNWIPSQAEQEGARTPVMLKTPPGLRQFSFGGADPVRGTYNAEGRFFAVIGNTLYQMAQDGTFTSIGTIPGVSRVEFSHNQITNGNEILIVNGSAGYIYNTVTGVFQKITDPGYPGAINAVFIDGYFVQIEPARRFAFNSDLADGLSYNTLDRFTSEVSPDLLVSMAVSNNELILFSETTAEFFENTGATQQPFRSRRISMQKGCAGRYTVANLDNTVFWLGDDGSFYVLDGYSPRRISTRPIEQAIRGLNWSQAFAFSWEDSGHSVVYWTFPDGRTWGYDVSTGLWHRRASYGLDRWRANTMTFWRQQWYAGDFQNGNIWKMDWDYALEGGIEFISERTTGVLHDNQNLVLVPRLELMFQVGQPTSEDPPLVLSGDFPNGSVGQSGTYQYTAAGGVPPYVLFDIASGSLPTGATMDAAGLVTYTLMAAGSFSWVVRVTDSAGHTDLLPDSSEVVATAMLAVRETGSGPEVLMSPDGIDWSGAWVPQTIGFNYIVETPDRVLTYTPNTAAAYRTLDGGGSFTASTGAAMPSSAVYGSRSPATGTIIINGNTSVRSTDGGATFAAIGGAPGGGSANAIGTDWYIYDGTFHKSTNDGLTFGASLGPFVDSLNSPFFAVWSDNTRIIVGSRRTTTSAPFVAETTDGATYNYPAMPSGLGATACVSCLTSGGGLWVAGLDDSSIIYRDALGVWHKAADTFDGVIPRRVTYNGSVFVMIGGEAFLVEAGTIKTSPDGNNWTVRRSQATPMGSVWRLVGCERSDT